MPRPCSRSGWPMPDSSSSCGELMEPALTITSRPARAACTASAVPQAPALALEQQTFGERVGLDGQVRPSARRVEIAERGAHAPAVADRGLGHADPVLRRAVVVLGVADADFPGRLDQLVVDRAGFVVLSNLQRAGAAAIFFIAVPLVAFHVAEDRQHLPIAPAAIAELRPGVVVLRLAAHEHHAVDRRRAAQQLAARHRDAALAGRRLGLRGIEPVRPGIIDQLGEADRDPRPGMAFAPGFQHQHPVFGIGAQPVGEHRAGRPGAHHDVIENLLFHASFSPSGCASSRANCPDAVQAVRHPAAPRRRPPACRHP